MTKPRPIPFRVPGPIEVLRALPRVSLQLLFPAMVIGAVGGSLCDILLHHDGYPLAKLGLLIGPIGFALAINAIERQEQAWRDDWAQAAEAYRLAETARRQAKSRAEVVEIAQHRKPRR